MSPTVHFTDRSSFPTRFVPAVALEAYPSYPCKYDPNSESHSACGLLRKRMIATRHCNKVRTSRLSSTLSSPCKKGWKNVSRSSIICCDPPCGSLSKRLKVSDKSGILLMNLLV